jgi:CheY-like chemotaxis protein
MPTRILVVDDSPTIRTVVSTILERHGYDPKVASDGQDAYDALASGEVKADLVLLDFVMPHMNGYQFCQAVLLRDHTAFGTLEIASLPAKERAVLAAVDGERTVRGIVAASHLSSFDACRILVQFLEARALRRRVG